MEGFFQAAVQEFEANSVSTLEDIIDTAEYLQRYANFFPDSEQKDMLKKLLKDPRFRATSALFFPGGHRFINTNYILYSSKFGYDDLDDTVKILDIITLTVVCIYALVYFVSNCWKQKKTPNSANVNNDGASDEYDTSKKKAENAFMMLDFVSIFTGLAALIIAFFACFDQLELKQLGISVARIVCSIFSIFLTIITLVIRIRVWRIDRKASAREARAGENGDVSNDGVLSGGRNAARSTGTTENSDGELGRANNLRTAIIRLTQEHLDNQSRRNGFRRVGQNSRNRKRDLSDMRVQYESMLTGITGILNQHEAFNYQQ